MSTSHNGREIFAVVAFRLASRAKFSFSVFESFFNSRIFETKCPHKIQIHPNAPSVLKLAPNCENKFSKFADHWVDLALMTIFCFRRGLSLADGGESCGKPRRNCFPLRLPHKRKLAVAREFIVFGQWCIEFGNVVFGVEGSKWKPKVIFVADYLWPQNGSDWRKEGGEK